MKIRKATIKDLDEIAKLSSEYSQYEHTLNHRVEVESLKKLKKIEAKWIKLGTIHFLVEENKKILGYLSINLCLQGKEKVGVIHTLIITKEARGRGIGKQLVKYALDFFKKKNCTRLRTFVHFYNKKAKLFWEKQGFELEKGYYASKKLKL